jgi:hypothetical protein
MVFCSCRDRWEAARCFGFLRFGVDRVRVHEQLTHVLFKGSAEWEELQNFRLIK